VVILHVPTLTAILIWFLVTVKAARTGAKSVCSAGTALERNPRAFEILMSPEYSSYLQSPFGFQSFDLGGRCSTSAHRLSVSVPESFFAEKLSRTNTDQARRGSPLFSAKTANQSAVGENLDEKIAHFPPA
jgi:hypothetical protein